MNVVSVDRLIELCHQMAKIEVLEIYNSKFVPYKIILKLSTEVFIDFLLIAYTMLDPYPW